MAAASFTGNSTSTNMSGRRAYPGLSASRRTFSVRLVGSNWGRTWLTRAEKVASRRGRNPRGDPGLTQAASLSKSVGQDPDLREVGDPVEFGPLFEALAGRDVSDQDESRRRGADLDRSPGSCRVAAISSIWYSVIPRLRRAFR